MTKHSEAITNPPASAKIYKDSWDLDLYVDELNSAISCEIFTRPSWTTLYYTWAGFQNYNLVVRVNKRRAESSLDFSSFPERRRCVELLRLGSGAGGWRVPGSIPARDFCTSPHFLSRLLLPTCLLQAEVSLSSGFGPSSFDG